MSGLAKSIAALAAASGKMTFRREQDFFVCRLEVPGPDAAERLTHQLAFTEELLERAPEAFEGLLAGFVLDTVQRAAAGPGEQP
jgi:hypothetical protein